MGFLLLQALFILLITPAPLQAKQKTSKDQHYLAFSSYQDVQLAQNEVARLKEQGYRAFYRKTVDGGVRYRVLAGPYSTKAAATSAGEKLKKMGLVDQIGVVALNVKDPQVNGNEQQKEEDKGSASDGKEKAAQVKSDIVSGDKEQKPTKNISVVAKMPVTGKVSTVSSSGNVKPAEAKAVAKLAMKTDKKTAPESAKKLPAEEKKPILQGKSELLTKKPNTPAVPEPMPEVKALPPVLAAAPPPVMPPPPATPPWPYFDAAMKDFQKGLYVKARPVFQDILSRREIGPPWRELAERRMADCMYFLKESNNAEVLSELVYQYKNILFKYPDIRHGNDLAYWRLGHLYKAMAVYVDAVDALNNLLAKYPGSLLAEEGLYQKGEILRLDKKYPEAVEALQTFYNQYPTSALSRVAIFALADTYYRMGRSREADLWYNSALQRWPDLYGLPDGIFLNTGYHFYNTGNYRRAFQVFSYFRSLYPQNKYAASAARAMAKSLAKIGQMSSAVRVLSADLKADRDQKEVVRNRLLLADLGMQEPKVRASLCFPGVDNYQEPLLSCDRMLFELKGDALVAEVLLQKGKILTTMNLHQQAFDTYASLLKIYPKSPYEPTCRRGMEETRNILVNDYYQKGDHLAVASLYFTEGGFQYQLDTDVLYKIADSLRQLGFYAQAAKTFQDLKNTQTYPNQEKLDLAIAEAEIQSGKAKKGQARLIMLLGQKRLSGLDAKKANRIMGDAYYAERNFDGAMIYYTAAMPMDQGEDGATLSFYRYADILKRKGQQALAHQYYQEILARNGSVLSPSLKGTLQLELAESCLVSAQYDQAVSLLTESLRLLPKGTEQRWALFRLTGGYLKTNNPELAEKSSGRVKENTDDPFWAKMADYGLNDGIWFATYEDYLK
jgi:tetratricopeptide (TPR) repeat protein